MSMKVHSIGRTVKIIRPYSVEQKSGRNGVFESRMVMWSFVTDRDYRQATTNTDGTVTQERHPDFFACRATGPIADLFNRYCSATKKDENGNDKLASRRIAIEGHLEKYNATRTEQVQLNNGQIIQVALPEEREIVVVESIEFLDANPVKNNTGTTATIVQTQPIMSAQPVMNVQPVMNAQPIMNAQPVAQVVTNGQVVMQPVANGQTVVQTVAEDIPVAPVVEQGTNEEQAPF